MSRFRVPSPWDDDDPAVARLRAALALKPTPEPVQDARSAPKADPVAPVDDGEHVARLAAAVRAGDRSAAGRLRELLGRMRNHG